MPIEIRELVIKATVTQGNEPAGNTAVTQTSGNGVSASEEIINACVEKILEIIKDRDER